MKKTLFIESRTGGDFTMDAVWAGLVDRLGANNVIDWPPKAKHREGVPVVTGDAEKDYGAERRSLCWTPNPAGFHNADAGLIKMMLANDQIERIFVDERLETLQEYWKLGGQNFDVPVVVIAGHDRFWGNMQQIHAGYRHVEAMFLDNWRDEYRGYRNAFPMCYATNFDHLWDVSRRQEYLSNKVYDVCFMGYNSHPDRALIVDHLKTRYGGNHNYLFVERQANTMDSFIRKSEYFKIMAQSRVCINLRGAAECGKALRFYEIPYIGSCMLSQDFPGVQVAPFVHNRHCMYFSGFMELDNMVEILLNSDILREKIAAEGHRHAMENHTARARVDYIYRCLNGQG